MGWPARDYDGYKTINIAKVASERLTKLAQSKNSLELEEFGLVWPQYAATKR